MTFHRFFFVIVFAMLLPTAARADFNFTHNARNYRLVTSRKTWANAYDAAKALNGYLVRINDAAENAAVLAALTGQNVATSNSQPPDGGGARYVWIGGYQNNVWTTDSQRNFTWTDGLGSTESFWTGGKNGSAAEGILDTLLYTNWGRTTVAGVGGPEPDAFTGTGNQYDQTGVGMAASAWPVSGTTRIGQAGQWNDLDEDTSLYYVVEFASRPAAPVLTTGSAHPDGGLTLTWQDSSANELGFRIASSPAEVPLQTNGTPRFYYTDFFSPANSTSTHLPFSGLYSGGNPFPLSPNGAHRFYVSAYNDTGVTESAFFTFTMPQRLQTPLGAGGFTGQLITHQPGPSTVRDTVSSYSASNMPAWLTLDTATGRFSGTPVAPGVFVVNLTVNYSSGASFVAPLAFRVERAAAAPVVASPVSPQSLATGAPAVEINLAGVFSDPDTTAAVRFDTVKGSFDILLYPTSTPGTVANFMGYVNRGDYSGNIVHRLARNFVIQGGGFKQITAGSKLTEIPDPGPIQNEPGHRNFRGTISMAKLGSDPDSATSEWFLSLNNNTANLDFQNGGFSVFGRIATPGLAVMDAIGALPDGTFSLPFEPSGSRSFSNFPHNLAANPPSADLANLMRVNTITPVTTFLQVTLQGNDAPGVCTAVLTNETLTLTPSASIGGDAQVTVRATDLDGNTTDHTILVQVRDSFALWAARQNFSQPADAAPDADKDMDSQTNFLEYAWLQDPQLPTTPEWPVFSHPNDRLALTFPVRKAGGSALRYTVQGSPSLSGPWSPVWSTTDGFAHERVSAAVDQSDRTLVTVSDESPITPGTKRFLRVEVIQQ